LNQGVTNPAQLVDGALGGFHTAFAVGALLIVAAAISGLLIRDEDAAATIQSRSDDRAPVDSPPDAEAVPAGD
jgi:hypothetical protein